MEEALEWEIVQHAMKLEQDPTETNLCSVCKSRSERLVAKGFGKKTHIGLMVVEVLSRRPPIADVHPLSDPFLVRVFACSNKMCGHLDFFSYVGDPEITP